MKSLLVYIRNRLFPSPEKHYRFTPTQLVANYERTRRALKLLRRKWSERLCEEDELEVIYHLDRLRKRLERKALAARLSHELLAERKLLSFASEVAAAANSCCLAPRVEDRYIRLGDA